MKEYVAGILLNGSLTRCVLIRKNKPVWQAGYLNAIGGSIEPGESPAEAMEREFLEEAGILVENWTPVLDLVNGDARIYFFKNIQPDHVQYQVTTASLEGRVHSFPVSYVLGTHGDLIPNLKWILPVMLAHGVEPFTVVETTRGGFK